MIYVGMDVHKRTTTFCVLDDEGKVVLRGKVASGEAGWQGIVSHWPSDETRVAIETGGMSWWVVDVLRGVGIEPVVVDARQFKMIADSKKKKPRCCIQECQVLLIRAMPPDKFMLPPLFWILHIPTKGSHP